MVVDGRKSLPPSLENSASALEADGADREFANVSVEADAVVKKCRSEMGVGCGGNRVDKDDCGFCGFCDIFCALVGRN